VHGSIRGIHDKEVNKVRITMTSGKIAHSEQDVKTVQGIPFPRDFARTGNAQESAADPVSIFALSTTWIKLFRPGWFP
jgi:hypothetical protein